MVGDDLWNDVQGSRNAGMQGWLVQTGKFREDVLAESSVVPDRVIGSVAEILGEGEGRGEESSV
jgi:ribonucleotide monophosphatase NagD (HAD superfamily)